MPSTVFRLFRSLEEKDFIVETDAVAPSAERKGRRPKYYRVNPTCAYVIGIDLSSNGAALLLSDFTGGVVEHSGVSLVDTHNGQDVASHLAEQIEKMLNQNGIEADLLLGIGIGAPGIVDIARGSVVRYARFPGMQNFPFREYLKKRFHVPVELHNNTSVIALAEYRYGRAVGEDSLVAVLVRQGVGGAYIQNGNVFVSQNRTAFEIGHISLELTQKNGAADEVLEDCLSEEAIFHAVAQAVPDVKNWEMLAERLQARDPAVESALDAPAEILVRAVFNVCLLLNPEALLLISRFQPLSRFLARKVEARMLSDRCPDGVSLRKVIALQYDGLIACRGAADLAFDHYFYG